MFDLDAMLVKKINQTKQTGLGKALNRLGHKIGGPSVAAFLNLIFTATLGFLITLPIYELGGVWAALPTGGFTLVLLLIIALSIFVNEIGPNHLRKFMRPLLVFAILFSLPFGILSISLLNSISQPHQEGAKAGISKNGIKD